MSHNYEFVQLDVFTRAPLTGNPLAIFIDARGVTSLRQDYGLASSASSADADFQLVVGQAHRAQECVPPRVILNIR